MSIMSAILLYCSIWALIFLVCLPFRVITQTDAGEIVPGTPASAPDEALLWKKTLITTGVTTVLFLIAFTVLQMELITIDDVSFIEPPSGGYDFSSTRSSP
ncbi:MAG TPA: DUF1467 family protein [Paracoccaceae bacterium]|nr:DUF1467 family protein [Paracoccaceae bacterium]